LLRNEHRDRRKASAEITVLYTTAVPGTYMYLVAKRAAVACTEGGADHQRVVHTYFTVKQAKPPPQQPQGGRGPAAAGDSRADIWGVLQPRLKNVPVGYATYLVGDL
jgi:hypothetical protein